MLYIRVFMKIMKMSNLEINAVYFFIQNIISWGFFPLIWRHFCEIQPKKKKKQVKSLISYWQSGNVLLCHILRFQRLLFFWVTSPPWKKQPHLHDPAVSLRSHLMNRPSPCFWDVTSCLAAVELLAETCWSYSQRSERLTALCVCVRSCVCVHCQSLDAALLCGEKPWSVCSSPNTAFTIRVSVCVCILSIRGFRSMFIHIALSWNGPLLLLCQWSFLFKYTSSQ